MLKVSKLLKLQIIMNAFYSFIIGTLHALCAQKFSG